MLWLNITRINVEVKFSPLKINKVGYPEDMSDIEINKTSMASGLLFWIVVLWTAVGAIALYFRDEIFEAKVGVAALCLYVFVQILLPRIASMRNPPGMQMLISASMISSQTIGRYLFLYKRFEHYDSIQHVLFGMLFSLLAVLLFYRLIPENNRKGYDIHPFVMAVFMIGVAMLLLIFWEFFEYVCDRIFLSDMQSWKQSNVSGLSDTMLDILMGLIGSTLTATLLAYYYAKNRSGFYMRIVAPFYRRRELAQNREILTLFSDNKMLSHKDVQDE